MTSIISFFSNLDIGLFRLINDLPHPPLAYAFFDFIHIITLTGIAFILLFIRSSFVDNYKGHIKLILLGVVNILFVGFWTEIVLKNIVQRPRPYMSLADVHTVGYLPQSFSMPSGQTVLAFSAAAFIYLTSSNKSIRIIAYLLAFITAFDRVYIGHHYPSDVIIGGILGVLLTHLFFKYVRVSKLIEKDKLKR
ncbi:MAG: phosphatase PAP2 family protein [Candidatus Dojkabacteria bacterium]